MAMSPDLLIGNRLHLRRGLELQVCHSPGQQPTLVFLHGGLGNRFNWRSQYEVFQARGQAVLAYDLAGHGQSAPYSRYSTGRHCRGLSRLLRHFHIQAPILCGHSYGVPLSLEWAKRHPVSGLVLVSGGTHNLDPWREIPLMTFFTWGGRHLYRLPGMQRLTNQLSSSHQHETIRQFMDESPVPTDIHPYRALQIFWGYNFFHRLHPNAIVDVPTLVMSGGQDPMFTHAMGQELASHFAQGQHLHFPNGGHLLMAEYGEEVNGAIATWLQQQANRDLSSIETCHQRCRKPSGQTLACSQLNDEF